MGIAVGDDLSISTVNYVVGFLCRSIEWGLWFRATSIYASVYTPSLSPHYHRKKKGSFFQKYKESPTPKSIKDP